MLSTTALLTLVTFCFVASSTPGPNNVMLLSSGAWRIATSSAPRQADAAARPLGFFGAAAFQWVNPKVWVTIVGR